MGAEAVDLPYVTGRLSFLGEVDGTPTNYLDTEPPAGVPQCYPRVQFDVAIRDARHVAGRSIDREGFVVARHPEGVMPNFRDESAVRSLYYPSIEALLCEVTGAKRVFIFDHTYRSSGLRQRGTDGTDVAVNEVHNDYTASSGPRRVRELLGQLAPGEDVDQLMRRRYAVFNIWRSINGVVEQWPLALCDMRSMSAGDFVDAELKWPHRTGYVCAVRHQERQRWFYFSAVNSDEAIIFKCFDSVPSAGVRFGAHTAFDDPTTRAGAKTRESIELRAIALF